MITHHAAVLARANSGLATHALRALAVLALLTAGTVGPAQAQPTTRSAAAAPPPAPPWTVTLAPQTAPLRAGTCTSVSLELLDAAGKEAPRTPRGRYVSMADFDMSASGSPARTIYGEYNTPNYWSVCSCKTARPGTVATITATYPSASIAAGQRVPGVAFKSSIEIPVAALPPANSNSPKCSGIVTTTQPTTSPE